MFTGLVEEVGIVKGISRGQGALSLELHCQIVLESTRLGDSILVDGVCLTVTQLLKAGFIADVMESTYQKTTLKGLKVGMGVHLERAMLLNGRFGGHIVSGHIDGVAQVTAVKDLPQSKWVYLKLPQGLEPYVVDQGSIAVNGVSLTVVEVTGQIVAVALIAHTQHVTRLQAVVPGQHVNIEVDVLAKYVEKMLGAKGASGSSLMNAYLGGRLG